MTESSTVTFWQIGGVSQARYEELRRHWLAPNGGCVFALLRLPWGTRLLHFGMLGLLDEDFTGAAWFGPVGSSSLAGMRCLRVLLGGEDGYAREREAYCCLLDPPDNVPLKVAEGVQ
jgi:hypothetical protein